MTKWAVPNSPLIHGKRIVANTKTAKNNLHRLLKNIAKKPYKVHKSFRRIYKNKVLYSQLLIKQPSNRIQNLLYKQSRNCKKGEAYIMFKPLSLYIALRYIRAKRRRKFISFISLVSMIGIALGVAVLITVLSVMNGFDQEIRLRIFSLVPHITITSFEKGITHWKPLVQKIEKNKSISGIAPYVSGQGLITRYNVVHPVLIQGISPKLESQVSTLKKHMIKGHLADLKPNHFGIILGISLAEYLGVQTGDSVNVMIPKANITPIGILPRFKRFKVIGIFDVGAGFGFNQTFAFMNLSDAEKLYGLGNNITGLQLKIDDLFKAVPLTDQLAKQLHFKYQIGNWTDQYGAFYKAVQMEKTMMFLILLLLVAIAAFNLVSGLVMLVNDKQSDIAILRTLGATPLMITKIFVLQGFLIGFIGTILGIMGGILLSLNVTKIVNFIQRILGIQLINAHVYFVDYLPSKIQFMDIVHIGIVALILSLLATIYPAWRASRTQPAEALRYE